MSLKTSLNLQSVEARANLDKNGVLHLNSPIRGLEVGEVLVVVVARPRVEDDEAPASYDDISSQEWNRAMTHASALAFLHDPAEDVYTLEDGEPIDWKAP